MARRTYGSEQRVKWYVVETTTIERVRGPAIGYTNYGGVPLRHEHLKEYMPRYAPKDRHEGYELHYGSSYENVENPSLLRHSEVENLMANFVNQIQIEASRPPNKYRTTSPDKYRHTSPNRYRHPTSPDKYRHSSPNKYRPTSPNIYQHNSPTHNYPSKEAHITFPSPYTYGPTSPTHSYPSEEDHMIRAENFRGLNKHRPTSPAHSFPSKEGQPIRTQRLSNPNKHHTSSPSPSPERGRHIRSGNFPGPNNRWHRAGLPTTRHQLTTPTNDINEALSYLVESVNYSTWSDPKKAGVNTLSAPTQSYEYESRYTRHAFGGATTQRSHD